MKKELRKKMKAFSEVRKAIQGKLSDIFALILIIINRQETAVVLATVGFVCIFEAEFGQILAKFATKIFSSHILLLICSILLLLMIRSYSYKEIKIYDQRLLLLSMTIFMAYLVIIGLCNNTLLGFIAKIVNSLGKSILIMIITSLAVFKIITRLDYRYEALEGEDKE